MTHQLTFVKDLVMNAANQWDLPLEGRSKACIEEHKYSAKFLLQKKGYPSVFTLKEGGGTGQIFVYRHNEFGRVFRNVAHDIVYQVGRVSLNERFAPFIIPNLTRTHPQFQTFARRSRCLLDSIGNICKHPQDWYKCTMNQDPLETFECMYAVDFDLGPRPYSQADMLAYVQMLQEVMRDFKAPRSSTICIVFKADDSGKLGLHCYFLLTRYWVEQMWWITKVAQDRFEDRWRTQEGKVPWSKIIDLIYNGSLRLPGLQKGEKCECVRDKDPRGSSGGFRPYSKRKSNKIVSAMDVVRDAIDREKTKTEDTNPTAYLSVSDTWSISEFVDDSMLEEADRGKTRGNRLVHVDRNCTLCNFTGRRYRQRRYVPCAFVNENGQLDNSQIDDFLKLKLVDKPLLNTAAASVDVETSVDLWFKLLTVCCIRVPQARCHTPFEINENSSRPSQDDFPRTWIEESRKALEWLSQPDIERAFAVRQTDSALLSFAKTETKLTAETDNAVVDLTVANSVDRKRKQTEATLARMRQKFESLALSRPITSNEVRDVCKESEFRQWYKPDQTDSDLSLIYLKQVAAIQNFLRTRTISEYKRLIVSDVKFSETYGNAWVRVTGEGSNHCRVAAIKRKTTRVVRHVSNHIYFCVRRLKRGELGLYQYCHDDECNKPVKTAFTCLIADLNVKALFYPRSCLEYHNTQLTEEQRAVAQMLIKKRLPVALIIRDRGNVPKHLFLKQKHADEIDSLYPDKSLPTQSNDSESFLTTTSKILSALWCPPPKPIVHHMPADQLTLSLDDLTVKRRYQMFARPRNASIHTQPFFGHWQRPQSLAHF